MKKLLLCTLMVLLTLTGCATGTEPSSANTTTPATIPETVAPPKSNAPDSFDLTDEDILLTEENSPDSVGGYVRCHLGYLVNYHEPYNPEGYLIVSDVDPDTLFTVIGVTYICDASCSPSTELESVPPVIREDFISAPHYEPPEDPSNIYDFDYFAYLGAVIPIIRGANGFLLIQETEISQVYCVPPGLLEFVGY